MDDQKVKSDNHADSEKSHKGHEEAAEQVTAGTDAAVRRPTARGAWVGCVVTVAVCCVLAVAALWVFDVIDLPGLGRFADRAGLSSGRSTAAGSDRAESAATGRKQTGKAGSASSSVTGLEDGGGWPAVTGAAGVDTKGLSEATQKFLSDTGSPAQEGYVIANGDGTVISSSNADKLLEPASTLKTLTALAATTVLDMDSTLDTQVILLPAAPGSTTGSGSSARTILLRGGGDMLLGSGRSDPSHVNGRAGLATLAQKTAKALAAQSVTSVRLVADTTLFGPVRRPATMTEDYVQIGYFAPTAALAVDEGRQSVVGSDPDSAARSTVPRTSDPAAAAVSVFADRLAGEGVRLANTRSSDGTYAVPAATTAQRKAAAGARSAADVSASVSGPGRKKTRGDRRGAFSASGTTAVRLATVSSAPLRQILRLTLRLSDNTLAEEFGRLVALKVKADNSPAGAAKAVAAQVRVQGVDLSGASLADCSGLSPGSRLSPLMLLQVMRRLRTHSEASAMRGLPVITADRHGYGDKAAGRVRLKSGSLDSVTSDSGVVLRTNGGFFYYSAIVNVPEGQWGARSKGLSALHELAGKLVSL